MSRGIPQTKWICKKCHGKGCVACKGEGKLYKSSVQEIIEKPLIKAAKAKKSKFHGAGREDVDTRCLAYRPFVIELVKPKKRHIDLKRIQSQINRSKKIKVAALKVASKADMREVKLSRQDKTYLVEVTFTRKIDKKKLKLLKRLEGQTIKQKASARTAHGQANIFRKRKLKAIAVKLAGDRKLELKLSGEPGLYIKELIAGDGNRTKPNIAELLNNKVKKIKLDVIKIG